MDERPKTTPYSVTTGLEARDRIELVLRQTQIGALGLSKENFPYVVPMNHLYLPGLLIFHGPLSTGKKMEMINKNPAGCYTVMRSLEELKPDMLSCHVDYESVICNGRIYTVNSAEERAELIKTWRAHYQAKPGRPAEDAAQTTAFLKFVIEEMTLRSGAFHPGGPRPLCIYTFTQNKEG
jgi:nitroimidazol reductase NimA-like FMN-containing flavoprotein (pyridoxamine 5'-phosphate oxidase superfamily)